MKVCRLASIKNFVSECGNLEFNTHIYRKPVKVSKESADRSFLRKRQHLGGVSLQVKQLNVRYKRQMH